MQLLLPPLKYNARRSSLRHRLLEPLLLQALLAVTYANGALPIAACAAAGVLLAPGIRNSPKLLPSGAIARAAFYAYCALALGYAFFPNYSDHAEPAITGLGTALLEGRPLYPGLGEYSFHGVLYGPLSAEIQAAAIYLGTVLAGLPVMLSSKLAGVLLFLAACAVFFRLAPGWTFGRTYFALFLLPFQTLAFWTRSEPALLLLVAVSFWAINACPPRRALLVLGICAGLASGLKIHGCLYIAPAIVTLLARGNMPRHAVMAGTAAAAAAFLLLFAPDSASLAAFLDYLLMARGHGFSIELFVLNLAFLAALWSPLIVALPAGGWRALPRAPFLALGTLQLLAAIIGSKQGGSVVHLLPFIPANALMFASFLEAAEKSTPAAGRRLAWNLVWIAMLLPGLASCVMVTWGMAKHWRTFHQAGQELAQIQARYPGVVMGLAGNRTYAFTFLRPLLERKGNPQIEYSWYMDLQLVGVRDTPLQDAFESCRIRHLAVPRGEPPFSMATYYRLDTPLFSDALHEAFRRRYAGVDSGNWYDVYECRRG